MQMNRTKNWFFLKVNKSEKEFTFSIQLFVTFSTYTTSGNLYYDFKKLIRLWTSFASKGQPDEPEWHPLTKDNHKWAQINRDGSIKMAWDEDFVRTHHIFSRILNFLFAIVFSRKKVVFSLKKWHLYCHFIIF